MTGFRKRGCWGIALVVWLSFSLAVPRVAVAESGIKLQKWSGTIDFSAEFSRSDGSAEYDLPYRFGD